MCLDMDFLYLSRRVLDVYSHKTPVTDESTGKLAAWIMN